MNINLIELLAILIKNIFFYNQYNYNKTYIL